MTTERTVKCKSCGKQTDTPWCPYCGRQLRYVDKSLEGLLLHCRKRIHLLRNELAGGRHRHPVTDDLKERIGLNIEKWEAWATAIQRVLDERGAAKAESP